MSDIQHDPACRDCRAVAGRENANTTWQCAAHVIAERDLLRAKVTELQRAIEIERETQRRLAAVLDEIHVLADVSRVVMRGKP